MSKGFHRLPPGHPWDNSVPMMASAVLSRPLSAELLDEIKGAVVDSGVIVAGPAIDIAPPAMTRAEATKMGFTGNTCIECGGVQMVRNGACEKCNACGATTGCS